MKSKRTKLSGKKLSKEDLDKLIAAADRARERVSKRNAISRSEAGIQPRITVDGHEYMLVSEHYAKLNEQSDDTKRLDWLLLQTQSPLQMVRIAKRIPGGDKLLYSRADIDTAMSQTKEEVMRYSKIMAPRAGWIARADKNVFRTPIYAALGEQESRAAHATASERTDDLVRYSQETDQIRRDSATASEQSADTKRLQDQIEGAITCIRKGFYNQAELILGDVLSQTKEKE